MDIETLKTHFLAKNELIVIGYLGMKRCYLNVTEEDAILRYCESDNISREQFDEYDIPIDKMSFDDEFGTYSLHE